MSEEMHDTHQAQDEQRARSDLAVCKFSDLLDQYAWVLKQVYEFPPLVLLVPLFKDSSYRLLRRVRVPLFPTPLVALLVKRHIQRRIHIINRHLVSQLQYLQRTTSSDPKFDFDGIKQASYDGIDMEKTLAMQRTNRALTVVLVLVLLFVLVRLMPLGQEQQIGVIHVASNLLRTNIEGAMNATPQVVDEAKVNTGIYTLTAQTIVLSLAQLLSWALPLALVFVPVVAVFHAKQWLFNHPRQRLDRGYSIVQNNHATKRAGTYALEKHVFDTMRLRMPAEFQLDLIVYMGYVAVAFLAIGAYFLWKVATMEFFGASVSSAYATVALNVLLLGVFLGVAAFFRRQRSYKRRRVSSLILLWFVISIIPLFLDTALSLFCVLWNATGPTGVVVSFTPFIIVHIAVPIVLQTAFVFIAADGTRSKTFSVTASVFPAVLLCLALASAIIPSLYHVFESVGWAILYVAPLVLGVTVLHYLLRRRRHEPHDMILPLAVAAGWWASLYWLIGISLVILLPLGFLFTGAWILGVSGHHWWQRLEDTKAKARQISDSVGGS